MKCSISQEQEDPEKESSATWKRIDGRRGKSQLEWGRAGQWEVWEKQKSVHCCQSWDVGRYGVIWWGLIAKVKESGSVWHWMLNKGFGNECHGKG